MHAGIGPAPHARTRMGRFLQNTGTPMIDPVTDDAHPVLIIEDDDDLRDVLVTACELNGYPAVGVANAFTAMDRLRAGLRPSLIVFDLLLPQKTGWEFRAEQLEDPDLRDIPAVAMSAAVQGARMAEQLRVEMLIPKPVDVDMLLGFVQRYCPRLSRES
jgi:CheY-like chemotaxis protein